MNRIQHTVRTHGLLLCFTFALIATPLRSLAVCGDGAVEFEAGETCDDGNRNEGPGDNCPSDCVITNCSSVSGALELDVAFATRSRCVGDCDESGSVAVNELITGVNIALGNSSVAACPSFDINGNGEVAVNELITAVNAALNGCPIVDVAGLTVFLRYPDGVVRIPGSGASSQVQNRVFNLPDNGFSTPNDQDYALTVVTFTPDSTALPPGRLFSVLFDLCEGAGRPRAGDFVCRVENAADTNAQPLEGVTCSVTLAQ